MADYDVSNPTYGPVRRLEPTDWNHADVFNATIGQAVENAAAIYNASKIMRNIRIRPGDWNSNQYQINDVSITEDSIVNVYFNNASHTAVQEAEMTGKTEQGALVLACVTVPVREISIDCIEIRNEVRVNAG